MKVKKIAALAVGAAMVGATLGFASAQPTVQDNIPKDFFVKDGQPNVKIVVGSQGAAMDVASAADIAVAIGSLLYTEKDVEASVASVIVKKDISYLWDIPDLPVFGGDFLGKYAVMNEDEYQNPADHENVWVDTNWYGSRKVFVKTITEAKNVTLEINMEGTTKEIEVPLDGTVVEGADGRKYSVVGFYNITEGNPTILLKVDDTIYALKEGETQIIDVKPAGDYVPEGAIKIPISLGDTDTEPYAVFKIDVPKYDLGPLEGEHILYKDEEISKKLTLWNDWTLPFNITMTDVNLKEGWAVLQFKWNSSYSDYVVNVTGGSNITLGTNSVTVNVTEGDIVTFRTKDGIFDFNVTKIAEDTYRTPFARLDFAEGIYSSKYRVDGEGSEVLDVHYNETQQAVKIWPIVPATITFKVLDVDLTEENAKFKILSEYYNASDTVDYMSSWSVNFTMTPSEWQFENVTTYEGNKLPFYINLEEVSDTIKGVPLTIGNNTDIAQYTKDNGKWWTVGSFKIQLVSTDPITIHITNVTGSDIIVDKTIKISESGVYDIPFHMPEIEVKLVTDSVKFVAVNTETKTETETETDYKVSFSKSFWSDNVWNSTKDEPIKPGVVRNFIEWDTQQGGEYAGTYNETAEVTISAIEIKDLDKYVSKYGVPPKDAKLVIPEGGIKVTVDLGYAVEENPEWNNPYCYDLGCDPDSVSYYPDPSNDGSVNGAYEGDTITIVPFNKIVSILDIGDDYFVYGHDYGTAWYKVGDEKTFEDYTFKVLDINIFEQKVLIQFSAPGMETVTESVKVGETYTYGGLHVTVDDAFIGSTQDVIAKLHVKVAGGRVKSGDEKYSLAPGYVTYLDIKEDTDGNKYIDKISFINAESIEGNPIDLFNTYEVKYVYTAEEVPCKKGNDEETKYLVNAKVVIDPYPYYMKQELGLGDMIKGFIIDDVTFSIDPTKAAQPAKVTTPITVLDTEIMEAGLDKVDSNLILVGGPVVNQVTAALADKFGVPTTYEEWAANETLKAGIYKYIDNCPTIGGHGVILVAGADREGTKAAAEALMEYIANLS